MISVRLAAARGYANTGWLDTYHSFSFADYYDPEQMGFSTLRVLNEDRIAPGAGFPTHPHRDMEIITYIIEGVLEHKDSMGNGSVIRAGDVQRMTAGTGVSHSEYNHSQTDPVHLLQIWILPSQKRLQPGYEQIRIESDDKTGRLRLLASPDGRDGSVTIHQDTTVTTAILKAGDSISYQIAPGRQVYIQLAQGELDVNGKSLHAGDGARVTNEARLSLSTPASAEVLLFDLP